MRKLVLFLLLSGSMIAQQSNPTQIKGTALVQTPVGAQPIVQPGTTQMTINTQNGVTYPGYGWGSINAAVTGAHSFQGQVNIPSTLGPGEMEYPGSAINNSGIATSSYNNFSAPVVQENRPYFHDSSFAAMFALPMLDAMNEGGDMFAFTRCIQGRACNVAIVGNSIHECMSGIAPDDSYCDPVFRALQRKFPDVTFNFINMSIGGTSIFNFVDPSYLCNPSGSNTFYRGPANQFYTIDPVFLAGGPYYQWPNGCTTSQSWIQNLQAFNPDVVIMGFVENTAESNQGPFIATLFDAMNQIHAFRPGAPATIILTTDEPPNPNWCSLICPNPGQFEGLNEGVRGLAAQTGTLLADADRYYNVLTYGVDPARRHLQLEPSFSNYPTGWSMLPPFTGNMPVLGGSGNTKTLSFVGSTVPMIQRSRTAEDYTESATFQSMSGTAVPSMWYRIDNSGLGIGYKVQATQAPSGGNTVWTFRLIFSFGTSGLQNTLATGTCTLPAGTALTMTIKTLGSKHDIWCNSTNHVISTYDGNINNGGWSALGIQNGTGIITREYIYFGNPMQYATPLISIQSMLGTQVPPTYDGNGDFNTNPFSLGGDGLHHPSYLGMDAYYLASFKPILDQVALNMPKHSTIITHAGVSSGPYGGLQDSRDGNVDFVNGPNGGRIVNNANSTVLETWDNNAANPHNFLRPITIGGGAAISTSSALPQVGTPTVGKAACIKAAGPPVVIGFCSTVVDATGGCTCN